MEEKIINNESTDEMVNEVVVSEEETNDEQEPVVIDGNFKKLAGMALGGLAVYGAYRLGKPIVKKGSEVIKSGITKVKTKFSKSKDDVVEAEIVKETSEETTPQKG